MATDDYGALSMIVLVVQWIGYLPPKEVMQVRFLPRALR